MLIDAWGHLSYFLKDFSLYLVLLLASFTLFTWFSIRVFRSDASETKKRTLMVIFFTMFSIIVLYSGFEAYFRYSFDQSDSLGFLQVNGRWQQRHVVFNNYYSRDRNFDVNKKAGVIRIGVLGDSVTMGYGIKDVDNRFSNILEKKLRSEGVNVEVYNLGQSGYDTCAEIGLYKQVRNLKFDWIIWSYYVNDAQPCGKSTGTQVLIENNIQGKIARFLSHYSFFFDYAYWKLSTRYDRTFVDLKTADIAAYHNKTNFQNHKKDVESLIGELKKDNVKTLVIIFPFMRFFPNYPAEDIHRTMNNIFHENGLQTIDMLDSLRGKHSEDLVVSEFDYHPNKYVNRLAADRLNEVLKKQLSK